MSFASPKALPAGRVILRHRQIRIAIDEKKKHKHSKNINNDFFN